MLKDNESNFEFVVIANVRYVSKFYIKAKFDKICSDSQEFTFPILSIVLR